MAGVTTVDSRRPTAGATIDGRWSTTGAPLSDAGCRMSSLSTVGCRLSNVAALILAFVALAARAEALASVASAENAYTNHAGNAIAGWPVKLTATHVVMEERSTSHQSLTTNHQSLTTTYPLSIFPESEQRRIAADFGQPRVPVAVKRAITGAEKAMARSRKRAEKGLCTQEESDAFCEKSASALRSYLDKQVKEGTITPAERKALGR